MGFDRRLITSLDELAELSEAWDAFPAARGEQADLYDSYAWFKAWLAAIDPEERARVLVPAVFDAGRLVGLLPMQKTGRGRYRIAGFGYRPRYRPIVGVAAGESQVLDALVEGLAEAGASQLEFLALPGRDPLTEGLESSLVRAGFNTSRREGSSECFVYPTGDWREHCSRFRKYHRTVKNFSNKAKRLGELRLRVWGDPGGDGASEGFASYVALHGEGWKGALGERMLRHRRELLLAADQRGWSRLYELQVAGVAAAAIICFRIGETLIAYSTVYDQRLAALSPGSIVMWLAHERSWEEATPAIVDYLPGHGAQKDQLGVERRALVSLTASRGMALSPLAHRAGSLLRRAARRMGAGTEAFTPRARDRTEGQVERRVVEGVPGLVVVESELDPTTELYLAVAGSHRSPKKMKDAWQEGDRWIAIGAPVGALVRLSSSKTQPIVREIVFTPGELVLDDCLGAVAHAVGVPILIQLPSQASRTKGSPVEIHRAILPLPSPENS